jgi:hypothetical protein
MPPPRKNPGEPMDCSRRGTSPFQTYVNHLITKKPEKIKLMLARALYNDDYLMDFNGQVHANECVFSYPKSNWYSVYLINSQGKPYWGESGAVKYYFQMDFRLNPEKTQIIDASIVNGTTETPDELMVDGVEMKNCIVKENGSCGNPEPKKKKKKTGAVVEDDSEDETSEAILQSLQGAGVNTKPTKTKMPREYFESLGSKALIIDWMIANMKPNEIFKCIQSSSLSAADIQQAQSILGQGSSSGAGPSSGASPSNEIASVVNSFPPEEVDSMIKSITKEQLIAAFNEIKDKEKKKRGILTLCKRAGVKGYSSRTTANGRITIIDENGEQVDDINEVLDECAEKEAIRLKKLLKITSISQDMKEMSKEDLMNYQGGKVRIPYSLVKYVKFYFPLIKNYKDVDGDLFASIPSVREDDTLYYFKNDDVLGKDLRALDEKLKDLHVCVLKKLKFMRSLNLKL